MISLSLILHAFHAFRSRFWVFEKFWGFSKLMKVLCSFWDGCCLNKFKTSCIASHSHYNNVSWIDVCLLHCYDYVLLGLDWAEPWWIYICMSHVHAFSCIRTFNSIYFDIFVVWYISDCLPLFLSLPLTLVVSWHLSVSQLRPGTLFILGHLLLLLLHLTLLPLTFDSMMRRANRTSSRTFHDATVIRNAKSFCQTSLTLTCPLSSAVGVGTHSVAPRSHALPWSYRSSTPIYMNLITLYPSLSLAFEVYAW